MTSRLKFKNDNNGEEYKIEAICNSAVYIRESKAHLPGFYYFVF